MPFQVSKNSNNCSFCFLIIQNYRLLINSYLYRKLDLLFIVRVRAVNRSFITIGGFVGDYIMAKLEIIIIIVIVIELVCLV